ncbi:MAG: 16S rRNA (cytosine(1402)-N(4))-methyltransferase RsmH [Patescibacteria group bacterium]|jgi:16S rRNA (cytosine1402-N4)-methyltransferase|nr:16S rRNA (cytosine(1402)-N(4))-methyltransferase RsmH [Patescibacteria group bacterium]
MSDFHQPVLPQEILDYLKPQAGDKFIDCTLGGGGHTLNFLKLVGPSGKVLAIDMDPLAIAEARRASTKFADSLILARDNFRNLKNIADVHEFNQVNGILLDLGLSSGQLQDQARGFSFGSEGQLDMRFGPAVADSFGAVTAGEIVNNYPQKDLIDIFKNYGEERLAVAISKKIIEVRRTKPIDSPKQLAAIIESVYHRYHRTKSRISPATKVFQALRIAVNDELQSLKLVLPQALDLLVSGGRLAVISYHSLEDRIVKDYFRRESRDCICPPEMPVCQCGHIARLKIITKKPVVPTVEEIKNNPRSRSAKLRIVEKYK